MAKINEKKAIEFPYNLIPVTKSLTDDQFGKLIRGVFAYGSTGKEPNFESDSVLEAHFKWLLYILERQKG